MWCFPCPPRASFDVVFRRGGGSSISLADDRNPLCRGVGLAVLITRLFGGLVLLWALYES